VTSEGLGGNGAYKDEELALIVNELPAILREMLHYIDDAEDETP
jgi:hypothetical protein